MLDFRYYFAVFVRRLPYVIVLVALGTAIGVTWALVLPPVYEAQARIVVESEQIPDELAASTVRTESSEQLQIIQQRILTRGTLLEMANRLNIYGGTNAPAEPMTPDQIVSDMRERIGITTSGGGGARGQAQATIVTVSFEAPTARMAADVTNEVVTLMLRENVEMRTNVAGQTLDFFSQQVDRLEGELSQINGDILDFKEANQEALPDSLEFRRSQQAALQERMLEQERAATMLRDRRDRLVSLYEQTGSIGTALPQSPLTPEGQRLAELRDQYAQSVAVLSLDNPRVAVLRSQIEALESAVAQQAGDNAASDGAGANPALTEYDLTIADLDGQLAFIEDQQTAIQNGLDNLATSIAATPGNALRLETLERNYGNLRTQYDIAVRNKASAETGDVIESLSKGERFSVIEQAVPPSEPTSPNRSRIAAMGVAGGVAMAAGFVALLEAMNNAIRRPIDLTRGLGVTPLVTFPYIRTHGQIWRRRAIVLVTLLVVLIGLPAGLWYVNTSIAPLQPLIEQAVVRLGLG